MQSDVYRQCVEMSAARQYDDTDELTLQQRCPLLLQSIPHAVQDDFSSATDDTGVNVLDPAVNDEFKVAQRSSYKSWKLKYQDFVPVPSSHWDKSETFQ